MGKKETRFNLRIMVIITCIVRIPLIDSTTVNSNKNVLSQLDGDDISGNHVDVCCFMNIGFMNWERNASGHTLSKRGISFEMLDWLSFSMEFEYECLPQRDSERFTRDNETNMDVWTSLYQLKNGMCNISPMPFVTTYTRFKNYCDFLSPFIYTPFNLLIPLPKYAIGGSLSSVWKPFENSVWIALLVSIAVTILLSIIDWLYNRNRVAKNEQNKVNLELHSLFIFGLLVSKAGFRAPSSVKMRLAGGAWCIAALILTNYYSSVLTSLITASSPVTIANSVEEVANNDDIDLVIQKGFGTAVMIADRKDNNPLLKKLDQKLKGLQNSLCSNQSDCFRQVIEKKATAFLHDRPSLLALVSENYRRTGRCNVAFAKESFGMMHIAWAISKNYSQYETYQRGILRMMETGLVDHWQEMYLPTPIQCMVDPSSRQAKLADIRNPALVDLQGLVPTFLFLLFGFILAFIALLSEWIKKLKLWKVVHNNQFNANFPLFKTREIIN